MSSQGKIDIDSALHIIYQLCNALDVLAPLINNEKATHFKVYPKNIFIANNNKAKIYVDFITFYFFYTIHYNLKLEKFTLTENGTHFFSPEEITGRFDSHNVHVYSLGIILYQMITGQMPFTGRSLEVAYKHVHVPAPSPRQYNPQIPPHIESAILKALEKDPKQRFQTPGKFARALKDPKATQTRNFFSKWFKR